MHIILQRKESLRQRKNPERSQNKNNTLGIEEQRAECHISSPQKPCEQELSGVKYLNSGEKKNQPTCNSALCEVIS